jgi:hypothetical protein
MASAFCSYFGHSFSRKVSLAMQIQTHPIQFGELRRRRHAFLQRLPASVQDIERIRTKPRGAVEEFLNHKFHWGTLAASRPYAQNADEVEGIRKRAEPTIDAFIRRHKADDFHQGVSVTLSPALWGYFLSDYGIFIHVSGGGSELLSAYSVEHQKDLLLNTVRRLVKEAKEQAVQPAEAY